MSQRTYHPAYFLVRFRCPALPPAWPVSFAIITAWATTGERWSAAKNQAADQRLQTRLQGFGFWHWRITGYSPEDGHAEEGWAVKMPLDLARELGREFHQDAIYWVSDGECWVTKCLPEGELESELAPVGSFQQRLDAGFRKD
ncbi:MAG: DUF3293 domain-containing protein [Planctomycetota bacterium]|jgi:hypothetical protein|nr:DUF3293 domain-containing protein [Blastopirellula sp.]